MGYIPINKLDMQWHRHTDERENGSWHSVSHIRDMLNGPGQVFNVDELILGASQRERSGGMMALPIGGTTSERLL